MVRKRNWVSYKRVRLTLHPRLIESPSPSLSPSSRFEGKSIAGASLYRIADSEVCVGGESDVTSVECACFDVGSHMSRIVSAATVGYGYSCVVNSWIIEMQ